LILIFNYGSRPPGSKLPSPATGSARRLTQPAIRNRPPAPAPGPMRSLLASLPLLLAGLPAHPLLLAAQDEETPRTTVGGYGEVHYTNPTGPDSPGHITFRRFVVYLAHEFSDRIAFRSELEVENARLEGGEPGGELALEQAYVDYRLSPAVTIRSGLLLPPIGIINEVHEPPTFNGVDRPAFDRDVIPTTWRELGVGVVGSLPGTPGLGYRVYLLNGLRASGFSAESGIRGGRQEGADASFANPSLTGRLEWVRPGLRVGGSFWYGGSSAADPLLGTGTFDNAVTLVSADARYDVGPFMFRGVLARISIADAQAIHAAYGTRIGSRIEGGYVEGAYNVLSALAPSSPQRLNAFVRHERYNTLAGVPPGVTDDGSLARRITTFGLTYRPLYNVVFKGDYQLQRTRAGTNELDLLSLGVGYQF